MLVCCIIIAGDHLNKSAVDNLIFVGCILSLLLLIPLVYHCICFEPTSLFVGPPCDLHSLSVLLACPRRSRNFNTYLLKYNCLNAYFPKPTKCILCINFFHKCYHYLYFILFLCPMQVS